jgi:NAD(P)-dependent dehydrogenase (short-subunit alcohol dehydrogenase family)
MKLTDKHVIVTGAASGIGAALVRRFKAEGARGVVCADLPASGAALDAIAREIGGLAVACDVSREEDIQSLVASAKAKFGPVDVFFSNAGISRKGHEDALDADWEASWRVHVMAHVFACRAVVPDMLARGEGYLVSTASAAGLLASMGSAPYGVTKHAAVALAEHLAIQYGDRGIRVSVLCPQAVDTPMYRGAGTQAAGVDGIATPEAAAECVVRGIDKEAFLILTHPEVADYMTRKAADPDRWLTGMRRLLTKIRSAGGTG